MKKLLSGLIFLLLVLSGCNPSTEEPFMQLSQPSNLHLEKEYLIWDSVPSATSYKISINEEIMYTTDTFLQIEQTGEYEVYIVALAEGFLESFPSSIFAFTIVYESEVDYDIEIDEENGVITWNAVPFVERYKIGINGNIYEATTNQFSYLDEAPGLLQVTIQGIYPIEETNVSNIVYIEHMLQEETVLFQYSVNSTQNIKMLNNEIVDVVLFDETHQRINHIEPIYIEDTLEISSDYIKDQNKDHVILYFYFGNKKLKAEITVTTKTEPYLISSSSIKTDGSKDIVCQFELFGGNIKQISGNELSESDFTIEANYLTIKKEYILNQYEENHTVSITYTLEKDNIVFGFLFISVP